MKLKIKLLDDKDFCMAVENIGNSNKLPGEIAYRAGRISRRLSAELTTTRKAVLDLLNKYAVKENGLIKNFPSGPFEFESKEIEAQHDAEFDKVMDREIEEKVMPLPFSAVKEAGLTGIELAALEPIMDMNA